jgi:hypothetical protein
VRLTVARAKPRMRDATWGGGGRVRGRGLTARGAYARLLGCGRTARRPALDPSAVPWKSRHAGIPGPPPAHRGLLHLLVPQAERHARQQHEADARELVFERLDVVQRQVELGARLDAGWLAGRVGVTWAAVSISSAADGWILLAPGRRRARGPHATRLARPPPAAPRRARGPSPGPCAAPRTRRRGRATGCRATRPSPCG